MQLKKYICDFLVIENDSTSDDTVLIKLEPTKPSLKLSEIGIRPGQFVQVATPNNATMLRRPISVCNVDYEANLLWLLVRRAGLGTEAISEAVKGDTINIIIPLGNGFSISPEIKTPLLVGGGVGVAPLLFLGRQLADSGAKPEFLIGAKTESELLLTEEFEKIGSLYISTDDGSAGFPGFVVQNPALRAHHDYIYVCGPLPMMKSIATVASSTATPCEVSLENLMACGLGACLCCVEKTIKGNQCVCTDGPVFNIDQLTW